MADYFLFKSKAGPSVLVDLDTLDVCWEGKEPNSMILVLSFAQEIEVVADFQTFVRDYLDYYDCRPAKEKPRRKLRQGSPPKLTVISSP